MSDWSVRKCTLPDQATPNALGLTGGIRYNCLKGEGGFSARAANSSCSTSAPTRRDKLQGKRRWANNNYVLFPNMS